MAFKLNNTKPQKKQKTSFDIDKLLKTEINIFGNSFNNKKKEAFYTELYVLLNAGISLKETLLLIAEEQPKEKDKELFMGIHDSLVKGISFSMAIRETKVFSDYEYYSIQIGEETGALAQVTQDLSLFFRRRNEQRRIVSSALSYPIVVMITAFLAIFFMLRYVVPMFANIFKQHNAELPQLTKIIISLSGFFQKYIWVLFIIIMLLIVVRRWIAKKSWYKKYSSLLLLKTPFVGELVRKIYISQYTQATALLISAKVPMLHSIQLTKKMINFYPLQKALSSVEKQIISGKNLSESLAQHIIFDRKMISLLKVAEETNQNAFIFDRLTTQYNDEVQYKSKMLSTVLEPIIIIFLGAVVAIILIAMYLPMFQLSVVIG